MIVVLDTNVFISSLLSRTGAPAEIVRRWEAEEFEVIISPPLIIEFERALNYPQVRKYLKLSWKEISILLKRLRTVATVVEPQMTLDEIQKKPDDNRVLECAVAEGASYIVTGDGNLLELREYERVVILNPVGFLTALKLRE